MFYLIALAIFAVLLLAFANYLPVTGIDFIDRFRLKLIAWKAWAWDTLRLYTVQVQAAMAAFYVYAMGDPNLVTLLTQSTYRGVSLIIWIGLAHAGLTFLVRKIPQPK